MKNRNRSIRSIATVAVLFLAGGAPASAADLHDVKEGKEKVQELIDRISKEEKTKIHKANDLKLKAREPLFEEQAIARAKNFRETAEIVARQGGDAKPLLDAADYFESQSELISKSKAHGQIPDGPGHGHSHPELGQKPVH